MKVGILFGAGAEVGFGLDGGGDFAKKVLGIDSMTSDKGINKNNNIIRNENENHSDTRTMNEAISEFYKSKKFAEDTWYPEYNTGNDTGKSENKLVEAALRKKYLENETYDDNKTIFEDRITQEAKAILESENKDEESKLVNEYTSYMGILDEKFYTLIAPKKLGPYNFWKVINAYSRAYLALVDKMVPDVYENKKDKYVNILSNPIDTYTEVEKFCKSDKIRNKSSYYKLIKKYVENLSFGEGELKIITTNYTPLVEIITGVKEENIAYLHGKLNWFESPREWHVYDVKKKEKLPTNEVLFPYIFVQSGIKPIVEERILKEYAKAITFLEEIDELLVVGFRLNYDDNHINSFVRNFLINGKKVTYLDFDKKHKSDILNRLRIENDLDNFNLINIDKTNCFQIFESLVKNKCAIHNL